MSEFSAITQAIGATKKAISTVVVDKSDAIDLCLACLVAGGHLLLQDLPGMGKTTLAHALAKTLGVAFHRVQFTSDMLPADLLGMVMYDDGVFHYHKGVIFTPLLLADEINRASAKTQSALLEAMEERQVSMEGQSHALPNPFFVIATQNPAREAGVQQLPQSQLDRFLMCLSLGYPSPSAERELLMGQDRRQIVDSLPATLPLPMLMHAQALAKNLHTSAVVLDYIQALGAHTRQNGVGLSVRGMLALKRAAAAYALVMGSEFVRISDVVAVFGAVADHRLGALFDGTSPAKKTLIQVSAPA